MVIKLHTVDVANEAKEVQELYQQFKCLYGNIKTIDSCVRLVVAYYNNQFDDLNIISEKTNFLCIQ